ncbi:MAG: alpha/beta fold hydrolase [Bacteroidales bacterium]
MTSSQTTIIVLLLSIISFVPKNVQCEQIQFAPSISYRYQMVDGIKIFYRVAGDKSNPVILLLHGYPSSSHTYRELIPMLAKSYYIIAPDNLGSGYSGRLDPNLTRYTFDTLAHYNNALLDSIGIKNYAMYMQDFGAPVGYRMYSKNPERITQLIIQNANAYLEGLSPQRKIFFESAHKDTSASKIAFLYTLTSRETIINQQYLKDIDSSMYHTQSPDAWTHDLHFLETEEDRKIQVQLFQDYYNNLLAYPSWQALLRKYQPKTLIVWGKKDMKFIANGARAYLRDLPRAELHLLNAGHFAVEEKAQEIAWLILEFLKK